MDTLLFYNTDQIQFEFQIKLHEDTDQTKIDPTEFTPGLRCNFSPKSTHRLGNKT